MDSDANILLDKIRSSTFLFLCAIYIDIFILGMLYILYKIKNKLAYKSILIGFLLFYITTILMMTYIFNSFNNCTRYLSNHGTYSSRDHKYEFWEGYEDYIGSCESISFMNNGFIDLSLIYLYEEHLDSINSKLIFDTYNETLNKEKENIEDKLFSKFNSFFQDTENWKNRIVGRFGGYDSQELSNLAWNYDRLLKQYSQGKRNKYIYIVEKYIPYGLKKGFYQYNSFNSFDSLPLTSIPRQLEIAFKNVDIGFLRGYSDNHGLANYYLGEINKLHGNYNKAENYYKKALQLEYDKDNKTTDSLAWLYIRENKLDLARALYEEKGNIEGLKELSNVNIEDNKSILNKRLFNAEVYNLYIEGKYDEIIKLYSKPEANPVNEDVINSLRLKIKEKEGSYDSNSAQDNYLIGKMYYTGKVPSLYPHTILLTDQRDYVSALEFWKNVHEHNGRETEEMRRILALYKIEEANCKKDLKACFYSDWNLPKLYDEN